MDRAMRTSPQPAGPDSRLRNGPHPVGLDSRIELVGKIGADAKPRQNAPTSAHTAAMLVGPDAESELMAGRILMRSECIDDGLEGIDILDSLLQ